MTTPVLTQRRHNTPEHSSDDPSNDVHVCGQKHYPRGLQRRPRALSDGPALARTSSAPTPEPSSTGGGQPWCAAAFEYQGPEVLRGVAGLHSLRPSGRARTTGRRLISLPRALSARRGPTSTDFTTTSHGRRHSTPAPPRASASTIATATAARPRHRCSSSRAERCGKGDGLLPSPLSTHRGRDTEPRHPADRARQSLRRRCSPLGAYGARARGLEL